ncbi:UNVERIFIED_CONTAM: hypothetical protein Sradi_6983200 [Sesamum radiatum]|uniref:Reverse transcriptase domain-containing protein n=1 Tax=Sesamum radiatum TaxID=300843 RepID=A0AAW2JGB7_SESRA
MYSGPGDVFGLQWNSQDVDVDIIQVETQFITVKLLTKIRANGMKLLFRPTTQMVEQGSKRWQATAVGYVLGKKPYFPQLEAYVRMNWMGLEFVSATSNGFYFFQFKTVAYMEEIIEGGPWLFQGQPIVLQCWEPGMSLRRQKHTKIPVWIRLKHLPVEYWTDEGLSAVASGVGIPLYSDKITKSCSRLDYARVCILLDYNSVLPKHLVVISPILHEGKEIPTKIDIEYEWLPQRCKLCCSLGHSAAACPEGRKGKSAPVVVFVKKKHSVNVDSSVVGEVAGPSAEVGNEVEDDVEPEVEHTNPSTCGQSKGDVAHVQTTCLQPEVVPGLQFRRQQQEAAQDGASLCERSKGKGIALYNPFEALTAMEEADEGVLPPECQQISGPNRSSPQRDLWAGILSLAEEIAEEPWLLLGDFNAVLDSSEVCGRAADTGASMEEFRETIVAAGLVHLPSTGCPFTWHNCSEGSRSLWKRLDRMLVNEMWLVKWPHASYLSALPSTSDHSPLVLLGNARTTDTIPFRFDNFLAEQPGFLTSVNQIWRHQIHGNRMYGVTCKLKSLKATFRAQRKARGDLSKNVHEAKGFLDSAQALFDCYKEDYLLSLVQCCRLVYCAAVKIENSMLQQRAKLRWLKYGDQCSKVFFRKINARRAQQRVFQITTQSGQLLTDMPQVTADDSAPGLFFKAAWPEIGNEICAAVIEFFQSGKLLKQINATLLTLIPKVQLPTSVSDYRPISCCNVIYKVITKILVIRMQRVLHLLIDYSQNAFVPGRSISDNILLAQELLAGYNQSKLPPRCTIKIDIQKAYDSVEWDFLLEGLRVFNFPPQFIVWINQCVSTATFSVALNGAVYGFFPGARGLRQGDPISPIVGVAGQSYEEPNYYRESCHGERQQILDVMGFQEGTLPIPLPWCPVVFVKALGRVQLIKSVLSSLHTYWASVFILPKAVLKVIEERMRSFLWKGASGSGVAKVAWEQICRPKKEGGLGIKRVVHMNQALYAKTHLAHTSGGQMFYLGVLGAAVSAKKSDTLDCQGLPSDSFLYEVLRHGHWMWPSVTDFTVNEIVSCLPNTFPDIKPSLQAPNILYRIWRIPWIRGVIGDFNAVYDISEVCGRWADSSTAMAEFRDCIVATELVHLPFTGCSFTWHNCSAEPRSLWKRLDRVLVNEAWLFQWPQSKYICALPSTSDHSPLILAGYDANRITGSFRFDNFLAKTSGFLNSVWSIWRHPIHGTRMYAVVTKLKALKPVFRRQRKQKGDLASNVQSAKLFSGKGSIFFDIHKEDILLQWSSFVNSYIARQSSRN